MIQTLFSKRATSLLKNAFTVTFLLFISFGGSNAQTTISTTNSFTNDTTVNTVTFNFQNTNAYAVVIKSIDGILSDYGQMNVALWYKTSAINGNPGSIATANGWTMLSAATISGIGNTTDNTTQPFLTGLNLIIPANTTYGIAVSATGTTSALRAAHGLTTFSIGVDGCNVISGTNIGYAGMMAPPTAPTFSPVAWLGKINFAQYLPCTGTPTAAIISGPTNVCGGAMFTLTSIPYPAGTTVNYQWQKYNTTTSTWQDLASQTQNTFNYAGIVTTSQFRLKTSCPPSGVPVYSNVLTVNIGSGLPGGTYTINNNAQSTATNFVSFSAAAAAMKCGITGPVIINVDPASGPYTEYVVFNNIPGASAVNKIRINGNGRILQYNNSDPYILSIFNMKGTKYMSLDSLTIRSLNRTIGVGISITDTAKYDSVSHCFIDMRSLNVSNILNSAGIVLTEYQSYSSSPTNTGFSDAKKCYIGYNHILGTNGTGGPYFGILNDPYSLFKKTPTDSGNVMVYNVIENFVYCGIYSNMDDGTLIAYNDIHCTNKAPYSNQFLGIVCWPRYNRAGSSVVGSNQVKIIGNRIHNPSNTLADPSKVFYGIELMANLYSSLDTADAIYNGCKLLIANNAIYNVNSSNSEEVEGIFVNSQNNYENLPQDFDSVMIYHNTIDISQATNVNSEITGLYFWRGMSDLPSNNRFRIFIKNNMVTLPGSPVVNNFGLLGFHYLSYDPVNIYAQRNNFYLNSPGSNQNYCRFDFFNNYPDITSFHAAYPSMEVGSLCVDPQYYSPSTGDFTPFNYALSGNGENLLADVPTDIKGWPRSSAPTPGAFEIVIDAGINALLSPLGTYCSSIKMVQVNVHNFGVVDINTVQLNWSLNGVLQTPVAYTGSIAPNGNATVNLGNHLFLLNTPVIIKAWTSIPNGVNDHLNTNDTLTITTQSTTTISVNIGPDDSICTGNSLILDAGHPGAAYMWDNAATTQTRTVQNTGAYYVKVTTPDGCIGFDTMHLLTTSISVNIGPDDSICIGNSVTLNAGHPGAAYIWDNAATTQARTVQNTGTYFVKVTTADGCIGFDTMNLSTTNVVVNIGPDDSICAGDALTLNAGHPGAAYIWDNAATTQARTVQNTGTYFVKVTTADGCIGFDTMNLSTTNVVVNIGPDDSICTGNSLTLNAGNQGAAYMWDNAATTQARTVQNTGTYYVTVTTADGCIGFDTMNLLTTSIAVNIGPDDSICTGNSLTLNAGYPGAVYMWDNAITTQARTVQNTGTYYVKVTTADGCIGFDTMNLSLNPLPVVDLGLDVELCEGDTHTFDAGNPGSTYTWDNGAATQTRIVDTAGEYETKVTDSRGCTSADTVTVTMKNMPIVDAISATHADSGLYTFYPLNPQYVINYIWNFGDGSPEVNGIMVQHQYLNNGIYTVTLKTEGECPGLVVAQQMMVDVFSAHGEGGTGINNTQFSGNITLYPNPSKDIVSIENKSGAKMSKVAVYNSLGQVLIKQETINTLYHQLNTSALASGLYYIRVETDEGLFIQKFEVIK